MREILEKLVLYIGEKERDASINDIWQLFNYDVKDNKGVCITRNDVKHSDIIQCLFGYLGNGFLISYWDSDSGQRINFERKIGLPEFEKILMNKTGGHFLIRLEGALYALHKHLSTEGPRKIGF